MGGRNLAIYTERDTHIHNTERERKGGREKEKRRVERKKERENYILMLGNFLLSFQKKVSPVKRSHLEITKRKEKI